MRIAVELVRFCVSSLVGFAADYALYSLALFITGGLDPALSLSIANVTARIVSACVNFSINRKLVFKSQKPLRVSAPQYTVLAAFILAGNTLVLRALVTVSGIDPYRAKVATEMVFFAISWLVQRVFIFRKGIRGDE